MAQTAHVLKYALRPVPFAKPPLIGHFDAPNITVLRTEVF